MKPHKEELPMTLLGARLRELRRRSGLTQGEMAKRLSVDRTTYTKYENGRVSPDHQALVCLAELHGVSVDCLLGREEMTAELSVAEPRDYKWELTLPERQMIQMFRQLSEEEQVALVKQVEKDFRNHKK